MWRVWVGLLLLAAAALGTADVENPVPAPVVIASLMPITSSQTVFMNSSTGASLVEATVAAPLGSKTTFRALTCTTSDALGVGKDVVVTGRAGPCGALADVAAFTCTIPGQAGTPGVCPPVTNILVTISRGNCFALKATTPAGMPVPTFILCSVERTA